MSKLSSASLNLMQCVNVRPSGTKMKTGNSNMSYARAHMTNSAPRLSSARAPETSYVRVPMTILGNPKDFSIWSRASSCLGTSSEFTSKCSNAPSVAQSEQDECDITALYDGGDCDMIVSRRATKEATKEDVSRSEPSDLSGLGSTFYSSDDEEAASDSDIEDEPHLLLLLLQEVEDQAAERVQLASNSSSFSSDEEEEQQQQEVEVLLDVLAILANAQSAYQLSISRYPATATVLTYDAHMGGQMPLYAIMVEEQEDEVVRNSQLEWDEWQARVAARTAFTIKVEAEEDEPFCEPAPMKECIVASSLANLSTKEEKQEDGEEKQEDEDMLEWQLEADESPCWEERMVEERTVAALLPKLPAVVSNLLHCSDAVCTHPASSLGPSASSQASTEEGRLLEEMDESTGAGGAAQGRRPLLRRLFGALGRAFTCCLKPSGVRC
ncbi:hypothetical protein FOA52_011630 [Chlamydomonas sp. UWO 241]|nr:hypothetical protein FOA52_011630 [Chlamydomonas sp. UWO 241]